MQPNRQSWDLLGEGREKCVEGDRKEKQKLARMKMLRGVRERLRGRRRVKNDALVGKIAAAAAAGKSDFPACSCSLFDATQRRPAFDKAGCLYEVTAPPRNKCDLP